MVLAYALWVMLDTSSPDLRAFHLFCQRLVNSVAEVENRAIFPGDDDWRLVIWNLALGLGINSNQVEVVPNFLHQLVEVPLVLRANGNIVRELVKQVKLLNRDGINLVQDVDAGDVNTISLNDIDQVIHRVVLFEIDVAVGDSVFMQNGPNNVV
jgi:hypothetical protein